MRYVDGYVLPVPRKSLEAYRRIARKAGKIWREHGALEVRECARAWGPPRVIGGGFCCEEVF